MVLTDEYAEKYTSSYITSLTEANENLRNAKAYEIALRKKISARNKVQMEDFDRWLLKLLADKCSNAYKGHSVLFEDDEYSIVEIFPYFEFTDVFDGYMFVVQVTDEEGISLHVKTKDQESLNRFIGNKALEDP